MASLLTLPLELLVVISSHLPTPDLCALRITCKQVEKSLYEWFSDEFFKKKQFMLSHDSLQTFIDISKHVGFSQKLTHVIIGTNVYTDAPLRFRDEEAAIQYIEGFDDQKTLISTGLDREMLTEAFQTLPNLKVVGIRDFNSNTRMRDGATAAWSSWGASTAYRQTGISLNFTTHGHISETAIGFTARIFQNVLFALSKAGRSPSQIEVLLRRHHLPDSAFHIPRFLQSKIEPVLLNLNTLLLNINTSPKLDHTHTNGTMIDTTSGRSLRRFLGIAPNLTHLRLNFQRHDHRNNITFLEWLSEPAPTTPQTTSLLDPPAVALSQLKTLELGMLATQSDRMLEVVTKFAPTLEHLSIWRVELLSKVTNYATKPNHWASFFRDLANVPALRLKYLKVGMLQQDQMYVNWKGPQDDSNADLPKQREYDGPHMV